MSNFDIFRQEKLKELIDPYIAGLSQHITPIRYEAITPDMFALLFRTTGTADDGESVDHYFASFEYDSASDINEVKRIIETAFNVDVLEVFDTERDNKPAFPGVKVSDLYFSMLLKVSRPRDGYWGTNFVLSSSKDVEEYVSHLDADNQESMRRHLEKIFASGAKSISVYKRPDGGFEFFFK